MEQKEYVEQVLEPRIEEAQAGKRAVFFVDAAHFVLGACLGYLWSAVRLFLPAPSGRQRWNVLAALNAITHEIVTVANDTYLTASSVCQLLEKLAALNLGMPITVFLDNARYQHCTLVIEKAQSLQIELCFLPAYSPNLNLIERVWRFVKKKCLYSHYYEKFAVFRTAITDCLEQTQTTYKAHLNSLLTLRFRLTRTAFFSKVAVTSQLFQESQFMTV